jgi:hypothetical protein
LSEIAAVCASLPLFGRTKCDVPITRKLRFSKNGVLIAALAIIGICSGTERRFGMNKAAN